ncbi:Vegetative incompatibility protein HET-E-1 [Pseudocercospora fuligena]|uniref:Vegetative incompatibility protein HET-E-1 n=1 Tax=Pseudocercospora fuligena TaxID=685502 RepID=A0A8H6VND9_9PEZI|nr:Vegetative incompatibility protein HET-E-1 [Pseudocercospora fuligena]
MGDNLNHRISQVTGIPLRALYRHATPTDWVASFSSDEKKSWLRNRQTTKPEDRAYCLLGLCGVHMAPLYGEGANAWVRLEEEILKLETRIRSLPRGKTEQASQLDQSGQPPSTRPKRKYSDGDVTKPEARKSDHHAGHRKKQHRRTTVDGPPYTSRQLGELNLVLNKTFTVRAKESRSRYDDGLVLLIGWQSDSAARPYVSRLGKVMKTHFGYGVQHTWLPEEGAKRVMDDTMRNFTSRLLPERSLRIIHYETHTTCGDSLLRFEGLAKPDAWQSAVFDDFKEDISRCQTDILVTTNSTSATSALSSMGPSHGRRLELLSGASSSTSTADTDIYSQEFTPNICEVLKLYAEEKPKVELTTSMMHRRLYMLPPSISKVVLLSFTGQERGAITLQPLPKETQVSTPPPQETTAAVTLEVSMRLGSASQIDVKTMNELARAMQELPHIESFRFNHMYAPKVELENFMLSVTQAMKMRPLVTRLRKRIEAKRRLQAGHAVESETSSAPVTPISLPPPRDTSNPYNWNETRIAEESEESTSEEDDQIEEDSRNE